MNAERLMLIGGVAAFLITVYWVRSRQLREKYAVVWVAVASLLLVCGLFPDIIKNFAESAHLAYSSAVLFIALGAIYLFSFSVSLSLSHQYRRNVRLMQELAIMEYRLQQLEAKLPASSGNPKP